jgi:UDP-N-acetylmuramyl pentapeptide phosphotransferase/UDP-N-acetylglucosamine-1-phosphate transferase
MKPALLALAYVAMIAAMLAALSIHYDVTLKLVAVVMTCAGIVGFIIFVDDTRQQRRKWRDHPPGVLA